MKPGLSVPTEARWRLARANRRLGVKMGLNIYVRLCQAHIFAEATPDWHATLKFRDVLRQNQELAREYDEYKRGLAGVAANKTEYAEVKSRWVDMFMLKVLTAPFDA